MKINGWHVSIVFGVLTILGTPVIKNTGMAAMIVFGSIVWGWLIFWIADFVISKLRNEPIWIYVDGLGRQIKIRDSKIINLIKNKALPEGTKFRLVDSENWNELVYSDSLIEQLDPGYSSNPPTPPTIKTLRATAAVIVAMVLFPPYNYMANDRVISSAYGFLFKSPKMIHETLGNVYVLTPVIDAPLLMLEILIALIVGGLIYHSQK